MQITIIATAVSTANGKNGKSYQVAEVTYKDASGKVSAKKLMSFTAPAVFSTMSGAKQGEVYEIESVKEGEYWQWKSATQGTPNTSTGSTQSVASTTPAKGNTSWQTAEERALTQMYIVRQSCLTNAVNTLATHKTPVKRAEAVALAREYVDFVFSSGESAEEPVLQEHNNEVF